MKKFSWLLPSLVACASVQAQTKPNSDISIGVGYHGETIFHPGVLLQVERDHRLSNRISIPLRFDFGYYMHKRSHESLFGDIATGLRFHLGRQTMGYAGIGGGLGLMNNWYNSDSGVYEVGDDGIVSKASDFAGVFFAPSVNLEFGYHLTKDKANSIWFRPKFTAQMGVNEKTLWHYAFEIGYSYTFKNRR